MKEKCVNHPHEEAISFCHSCGKYFCADCLSTGRAYYYCKDEKCQISLNEEIKRYQDTDDKVTSIAGQRWKEDNKRFFKKSLIIFFVLWLLFMLFLPYGDKLYYIPINSFIVCVKLFIIVYLIRITIYKRFFWRNKLSKELLKENAQ